MKKLIRRLLNTMFSLITTCLIMVSPVAAMVYASEPTAAVESFSIKETTPARSIDPGNTYTNPEEQEERTEVKKLAVKMP